MKFFDWLKKKKAPSEKPEDNTASHQLDKLPPKEAKKPPAPPEKRKNKIEYY